MKSMKSYVRTLVLAILAGCAIGMGGIIYLSLENKVIGALMFMKGLWVKPGVHNVEEFDPDPFMDELNKQGLPWHEIHDGDLEV